MEEIKNIEELLMKTANEDFIEMVMSHPRKGMDTLKVRIRPIHLKDTLYFQVEEYRGRQVFHENMLAEELAAYGREKLEKSFQQGELRAKGCRYIILIGKRGNVTIKGKRTSFEVYGTDSDTAFYEHNRQKNYILKNGIPVPFLIDLGVMSETGQVHNSHYDKFRQINRFLEFIRDVLPEISTQDRPIRIIDFGCGKSYLTFAIYYYLHELNGYELEIIGLDLKEDVIQQCKELGRKYGYTGLHFYQGDIANFEGVNEIDLVVTLHACDTATDYALAKAVEWGAKVIFSVPCCQHELNKQMRNELLQPVLSYGIIKERMAALYTDAIRAQLLEGRGYRTKILEFIDMEHTPKNLLIRAVKTDEPKKNREEIRAICEFLKIQPTLKALLADGTEGNGFYE